VKEQLLFIPVFVGLRHEKRNVELIFRESFLYMNVRIITHRVMIARVACTLFTNKTSECPIFAFFQTKISQFTLQITFFFVQTVELAKKVLSLQP
jgi:hypothetical protein